MTRHPTARRVPRPDPDADDAFVAGVLETTVWARKHQRSLIIGGIVLAVALTSLVLWLSHRSSQREQAAVELSQVRAIAMSGNAPLAIRELESFVARFGGTPSGDEARLLLARNYMEAGQFQQAASTVDGMARNVGSDLGVNAAMLLAAAHEAAGNPDRAEETYLRVGSGGRFLFQRQEALDQAARIRLQRGDAAGAVQLYERIVGLTPEDSPDRGVFELRLGEVRARAASPTGSQPETVPAAPTSAQPGAEGAPLPFEPVMPGAQPDAGSPPEGIMPPAGTEPPATEPPAGTEPPAT